MNIKQPSALKVYAKLILQANDLCEGWLAKERRHNKKGQLHRTRVLGRVVLPRPLAHIYELRRCIVGEIDDTDPIQLRAYLRKRFAHKKSRLNWLRTRICLIRKDIRDHLTTRQSIEEQYDERV